MGVPVACPSLVQTPNVGGPDFKTSYNRLRALIRSKIFMESRVIAIKNGRREGTFVVVVERRDLKVDDPPICRLVRLRRVGLPEAA